MVQKLSKKQENVLVVCHGNICRSPLVASVLQLHGIAVRSRGLNPDPKMRGRTTPKKIKDYVEKRHPKLLPLLQSHKATQISNDDTEWADRIIYMDGGNLRRLKALPGTSAKLEGLGNYVGLSRIADPNYISRGEELDQLLQTIVVAAEKLAKSITKPLNKS